MLLQCGHDKKAIEWQHVTEAVNADRSEGWILSKITKKWFDVKVEAKRCIAVHRQSVCAMGRGKGTPELNPLDERLSSII